MKEWDDLDWLLFISSICVLIGAFGLIVIFFL